MTNPDRTSTPAPLRSLRVIDMTDGKVEMCGRYLADLGAEVVRVEPPGGASTRHIGPKHGGVNLREAVYDAGKLGVTLDPNDPDGHTDLIRLLSTADIWITTAGHAELAAMGVDDIHRRLPALVHLSVTDFGLTGPYRDFAATEWVHAAMSGVLCRSGIPGHRPLLPPHEIVEQAVAGQAAWCALVGHYHRLNTGRGDLLDVSIHETVTRVFDPAFGAGPTAGYGRVWHDFPYGRPDASSYYPVYPCADGHVRICVLSPGQWRVLRQWLGEPEQFQDPKYDTILARQTDDHLLRPLVTELFAGRTAAEATAEGQRRGLPIAPVLRPDQITEVQHYRQRGSFTELEIAPDLTATVPAGYVEFDGLRAGPTGPSPRLGEHNRSVLEGLPPVPEVSTGTTAARDYPLAGLRVLDLGVIVMGAETSRLFADLGADVVKIENSAHPDGTRAPFDGTVTTGFAWGHRGKRSLAVDLRDPRGVELFDRLAADADVMLSNFKPGTLEKLGLGHDRLAELNPRLVCVETSAVGHTGDWRGWMGYGPLVRAATGLTMLWQDPDVPNGFSDAVTAYPDHPVARIVATAALAALIERRATGQGHRITCSEAETILTGLSAQFARESLAPGTSAPHGNRGEHDAPYGVFRCAGDDQWCVITVRNDADYKRLCLLPELAHLPDLPTAADRVAYREEIEAALGAWTAQQSPETVFQTLQRAGVPAGPMRRPKDYASDPAMRERRAFTTLYQPTVPDPLPTENGLAPSRTIAPPDVRAAPLQGQHTREVCAELGLGDAQVDELISEGVLEEPDPFAPLRATGATS